jgi:long-chain-fatty-acid---luciferin-component ligase
MDIKNTYNSVKEQGGDPVKWVISNLEMLFRLPLDKQQTLKTLLISDSFRYHYENNAFYRERCINKKVSPDDIHSFSDLVKIPVIPVNTFKSPDSHKLLTKPLNEIEHEMRSTGTSGIPSVARRCGETMDNAVIGIYAMYREMFSLSKGAGLFVCPSTEEIPEMGMIKAFNFLAGLFDTHRFMVKEERFSPENAIEQLEAWDGMFTRHIIGPPFLIHRLLSYLRATNRQLTLDAGSLVITLGGWKRFTGEMISRKEFNREIETYLAIPARNVRDMYGLVEANVLAIEDEYNHKHIPPYIHFSVRDPENLGVEVAEGEPGQLVILDPLSRSTPGMLLTEDIVYLRTDTSKTSKNSQRMQYVMRAPDAKEFGCCAVTLEETMSDTGDEVTCPVIA